MVENLDKIFLNNNTFINRPYTRDGFFIMKIYLILISFLFACTNKKEKKTDVPLQSFFEPLNWEVTNKWDTSYIFFSPVHDSLVETYEYKIADGDSVSTQKNEIAFINDSIHWKFHESFYTIKQVDSNIISLELDNKKVQLNKISDSLMVLKTIDDSFYFRRTLPISTFLVRKKYDFINGTSGSDSAEVLPRKMRKSIPGN